MINSEMLFVLDLVRYTIYAVVFVCWQILMRKLIIGFKLKQLAPLGIATHSGLLVLLCFYEALIWGLRV
ncbi:MAG: hypothetical protein GDA45_06445 [Chromatiales bacterium]|nr:hypothetical protein [Chromatiales bacterium]